MQESTDADQELGYEFPDESVFGYYRRLQRVRDHLLSTIAEPLSAERAAEVASLSPNYFSTYFRQRVGVSFSHWSHGVRVSLALELLRTSDLGISEVAFRVGYRDLRTFERAFKRVVRMTPRSFRARVLPRGPRRVPPPGKMPTPHSAADS